MSELTKIASILFKNLSDALLLSASEVSRLDSAPPLSQADEKPELVSLEPPTLTKRDNYKIGDRIMVKVRYIWLISLESKNLQRERLHTSKY